jgi:TPP-dependent indolepyruvate ferredoxin oxidoreductase alpha subunit
MIAQGLAGKRISADIGTKSKAAFKPTPADEIFTGMGRSIEDARRAAANE